MSNHHNFEDQFTLDKIKVIQEKIREYNKGQSSSREKISILYVDDEERALKTFKSSFRREFDIYTANSAEQGKAILKETFVEVIISDQRMEKETGIDFFSSILEVHPDPIRILLTGFSDIEPVIQAINEAKVYRYMSKPYNMEDMKQTIEKCAEVYKLREAKSKLTEIALEANQQLEFMLREKLNML